LSSYAAWDEDENAMDLFWDKVKDHLKKVYWFSLYCDSVLL
jgi:hypothetical protein